MRMFLFLLLVQFVSTASASRTDSILTILDSELGKRWNTGWKRKNR